jgi:hypothetical protein
MQIDKIPAKVLSVAKEVGKPKAELELMTGKELFEMYCDWEGLINYGDELWELVMSLRFAELGYSQD